MTTIMNTSVSINRATDADTGSTHIYTTLTVLYLVYYNLRDRVNIVRLHRVSTQKQKRRVGVRGREESESERESERVCVRVRRAEKYEQNNM